MCLPAGIPILKRVRMAMGGNITRENLEIHFLIFGGDFNYPVNSVNDIRVRGKKG